MRLTPNHEHRGGLGTITFLTARFWPESYGGLEHRIGQYARAFARRGFDVRVLTENRTNRPAKEMIEPGLTVYRQRGPALGPMWRWPEPLRVAWWRSMVRRFADEGPVFANEPLAATGAILAGRKRDLVFHPPGILSASHAVSLARPECWTLAVSRTLRKLDALTLKQSPRVLLESENVRREAIARHGLNSNTPILFNGIASEEYARLDRIGARRRYRLSDDQFTVAYVGRLDPCKDLPFLFRAAAMGALGPTGVLLVAGDGPDRTRLERIAETLGISQRILWAGRLTDPRSIYAAADALVLCSVYETFGNVIMEAMASGLPVIGRKRDADPNRPVLTACDELIADERTGLLADSHHPEHLAQLLTSLRLSPAFRRHLGVAAQRWTRTQTWDARVDEHAAALDWKLPRQTLALAA